jgi:phosphoglycerate dehydrogenase-like enzyme
VSQIVVGLGPVATDIVQPVLGVAIKYIEVPTDSDLASASGAIVRANFKFDESVFNKMPNLKVIGRTGVGTDLVDLKIADEKKIPVVITPGSNTIAVAEGTFAHLLALAKRIKPLTKLVADGEWNNRTNYPVGDLAGNTLGIVGYGRIGREVAKFATAFGMKVKAFDPFVEVPSNFKATLDEIYASADYITLHIPLTPENENLISSTTIAKMKNGVNIINCSRGALINLDDALSALQSGKIGGLGLDVFDPEPPQHHEIFDHENVLLTPHVMGLSKQSTVATFIDAAQGVRDVLEGKSAKAIANLNLKV